MNGTIVLIAVLLVLFLIGQIRVGGQAEYGAAGVTVWIKVGRTKIQVVPAKSKDKPAKQKKVKNKPQKEKPKQTLLEKAGGALDYANELLPIVLKAAGQFKQKLRADKLILELTVGGTNPADAAMLYGQASATLGAVWYPLTEVFHVKDGRAHITVDFDAEETTLYALLSLSLKLWQLLWLGLYFGLKALLAFLAVRREQKRMEKGRKAA